LWLLIAIAIKLDSPGPVFFRQEAGRPGREDIPDLQVPIDDSGRPGSSAKNRRYSK